MHGGPPTRESEIIYVIQARSAGTMSSSVRPPKTFDFSYIKKYFANKDGDYPAAMVKELASQRRDIASDPKRFSFRVLKYTLESIVEEEGT